MRFSTLSIRTRLVGLFILQMVIVVLAGGIYLDWQLRLTLEQELSDKLQRLAATAAQQIDSDLVANVFPGDEQTRTVKNLRAQLKQLKGASGARRIFVFGRNRRHLLSTGSEIPIGATIPFLPVSDAELSSVFAGHTVASTLFTGHDGRLYKTGFAPIVADGQVIAALALEGSANTLDAVRAVRRDLLLLGLASFLLAVFLGVIFAERITTPISRLKAAAQRIARGDYESAVEIDARDEIGFLGATMEEMRRAITQRDTRQKTMLAGVAHEIRNPLGGIELFAGLLASELSDHDARQQAQKIQREVQNLKRIVSDFLDYARPNKPRKAACVVKDIVSEVQGLLPDLPPAVEIRFSESRPGQTLICDQQHLKQILLNLIKNAVEAMGGNGSIAIQVPGDNRIIISDSGPGIAQKIRPLIFEPFFTTRNEGTGLGLAIVKSLVEENGGEIRVVSSKNGGAAFEIRFEQDLKQTS